MFAGALSVSARARTIFTMDRVQPAKRLGRTLIGLAVIVASAVALSFFISLDDYIPQIETWAATRLKEPRQPLLVRVESIRLNDARVLFARQTFGPFDARVSLDSNGELADGSIATQDGKLKVLIKPGQSNTVDVPLLYPTAGAVAGAAVGTVMLGPGFGTSVGAKIGGWAEGLFDKPEEKKSGK